MRTVTEQQRRDLVVHRHRLDGSATSPEDAARSVLALHATDPASVYLSVLARSRTATIEDTAAAMYERLELVRWLAMRRTLFVFPVDVVPTVQAAVSTPLAERLHRQIVSRIRRNGSEPAVDGDIEAWLRSVADDTVTALEARGRATGAQLGASVPGLRTTLLPGAPSERPQKLTSTLLAAASADGRIVRSVPVGAWTSRGHLWESASSWWPHGLQTVDPATAERDLARLWLERFGPATADDLQWWTGWTKATTKRALAALPIEDVDLHGEAGIDLVREDPYAETAEPVAALLPALDPTAMGWTHRDWYFAMDRRPLFDTAGNIGPTLWWGGEIVGGWAVSATGEIRTSVIADRGQAAVDAIAAAAHALEGRLGGTRVVPAVRTPLERELSG